MAASMNLTLKRGPSVWEPSRRGPSNWRLAAAAVGTIATALAWRSRASRRFWLAGFGLSGIAFGVLGGKLVRRAPTEAPALHIVERTHDDAIDRASEDSFPASESAGVELVVCPR